MSILLMKFFSYSLFTEWTFPVPLCKTSRRLCGSELLTLSGQWLELQYLFHRLFIKLRFHPTVYHLCSFSLWVSPAGTSCSPGHCPPVWWPHFPIKAIYLPVIWLMCLPFLHLLSITCPFPFHFQLVFRLWYMIHATLPLTTVKREILNF